MPVRHEQAAGHAGKFVHTFRQLGAKFRVVARHDPDWRPGFLKEERQKEASQ